MSILSHQTPIQAQPTLGGSAYHAQYGQTEIQQMYAVGLGFAAPFNPHGRFSPVASEELLANRPPVTADDYRRKRCLPLVKAIGRPIVQAEIDDALDD